MLDVVLFLFRKQGVGIYQTQIACWEITSQPLGTSQMCSGLNSLTCELPINYLLIPLGHRPNMVKYKLRKVTLLENATCSILFINLSEMFINWAGLVVFSNLKYDILYNAHRKKFVRLRMK